MTIERKITINNREFFLGVELEYGKNKFLTKSNGTYFDMGDFGIMINYVEENYNKESKEVVYDDVVAYMNDIIYLYDRFPFISYIKDVTYNSEGHITCVGCINNDEITNYIKENGIEINRWNKDDCPCPLLYK